MTTTQGTGLIDITDEMVARAREVQASTGSHVDALYAVCPDGHENRLALSSRMGATMVRMDGSAAACRLQARYERAYAQEMDS